ncbi:Gfo/Idh/MocA family oxidoreductase [Streptomyces sp. SID13666]|uniref:Gfo/Idh/MocA family protein n=1 Tax=unclassified Streptomyces TaxID=2593676 RepID=UPI0013C24FF0|nr:MULTISPECIES: Gfo/Idh/MocA family oxidoreductase [unclassified Streptomyces]NEA53812.1 Gfo/Idh/MocA family oxidoreductase [Streptomyces sp. SID13666]NEA76740.1 Gfo/Idh/MocA family oxidoreductase [Streptomyces sp. SID13588]
MSPAQPPALGVGLVGYSFMGRAHSQAWRSVGAFFELPRRPAMVAVAGRSGPDVARAAEQLGWAEAVTDVKELLVRDDIHVLDICTPGDSHAELAVAALEAGKHVLCEKPLANTVAEAEAMTAAAERAAARGVRSMVGFNYRRVPAIALARRLVADGRLGRIRHIRAQYLQDWITDPLFPLVWRLQKERAGSGALGDIGAHIIDLAQFVGGSRITGVSAVTETFVKERPLAGTSDGLAPGAAAGGTGPVTVDDAALFTARTAAGALASFEATRFAAGRKNALRIELNGSEGSLAFDFESMNDLWFHDHTENARTAGFRRILVTEPDHPYAGAWWPPGHLLGYEHSFTHEIRDFVQAIGDGSDPAPSFADGLQVQRVLAAVEASARDDSRWTPVG